MIQSYELNIGAETRSPAELLGNVAIKPNLSYYSPDVAGGAVQVVSGSQRPETNPPAPTNPRDNR